MEMKTNYRTYENVSLRIGRYQADNSIAIQVWSPSEGPIATLTVCLCDKSLREMEAYIDTNNCPWAVDFIEKEMLGIKTERIGRSGYCTYPVVRFDMEKLKECGMEAA